MRTVLLKDICTKIGSGATPKGGKEAYQGGEYTLIRSQNVLDFSFLFDGLVKINTLQAERLKNVEILPDDVLLNITGDSVARACMVDNSILPARVNQHVSIVRTDKTKALSSYILYYLQSIKPYLLQLASSGATRNALTKSMIENLAVDLPSLDEQRKIVATVDLIQAKIRNNNKINENLAQQALAVFLHIFADSESVTPATIADVALNVTDGVHNTVHDDPEGDYLLLSCKNIKGGSLSIGASERRINSDTFEKLRRRTKLAKGDVLISSVGTIGELLLLNVEPSNYEFQRSVAIVKPNPTVVSSAYLYESLVSKKAELINAAHGAVQQCLFISDIAGFPIGIPTSEDLQIFDEIVAPMFDAISANEAESMRLVALRDTLLPRLMSGELDVSELSL